MEPKEKTETTTVLTEADKLWNQIKDLKIEMFALPDQTVSKYCIKAVVEPSKLYLLSNVGAFLPALEMALNNKYLVETMDKYIVVSKKSK